MGSRWFCVNVAGQFSSEGAGVRSSFDGHTTHTISSPLWQHLQPPLHPFPLSPPTFLQTNTLPFQNTLLHFTPKHQSSWSPQWNVYFSFPLQEQQKTNIKTLITGLAIMMLNVRNLITEWKLVVWAKITSYHCINYYTMESGVKAKGSS